MNWQRDRSNDRIKHKIMAIDLNGRTMIFVLVRHFPKLESFLEKKRSSWTTIFYINIVKDSPHVSIAWTRESICAKGKTLFHYIAKHYLQHSVIEFHE